MNFFCDSLANLQSIKFLSKTRINHEPLINVNVHGYKVVHFPPHNKAGGVAAYFSHSLKFISKENFDLNIQGCEDLWFDVEFSRKNNKFVIAVTNGHPYNKSGDFIESIGKKLQELNSKRSKFI